MKRCPAECSTRGKNQTSVSVDTIESRPGHIPPISSRTSAAKPGGGEGAAASSRSPAAKSPSRSPVPGPSGQVSGDFGKEFMNSLVDFMEHSHALVQNFKNTSGQQSYSITETERANKIQEIMSLISQKEKELVLLEQQRDALDSSGSRTGSSQNQWPSFVNTSSTIHSSDLSTPITIHSSNVTGSKSCKGACSRSSTVNTEDLMTPPSQRSTGSGRPGSSPYEVESSAYDYTCEEECQAACSPSSADILNTAFIEDDSDVFNTAFIADTTAVDDEDVFNTAFIADDYAAYPPQQYTPPASPPRQQYISPGLPRAATSTPKSGIGSGSSSSGRSASSCYCPPGFSSTPNRYRGR